MVEMLLAATLRIKLLALSEIEMLPDESTATANGPFSSALVAAAPSPEKPAVPFPAIVEIVPEETCRMRLLPASVM